MRNYVTIADNISNGTERVMMDDHLNVVEKYGRIVYGIAMSKMGHIQDAEDVFQEVFLTYVKKKPVFFEEERARAWFARTTINQCKMMWRNNKKHAAVPLEEAESLYIDDDLIDDVSMAVKELPRIYSAVIELYYFAGLSTKEIANILRITTAAVRTRLKRGRKMLEAMLSETELIAGSEAEHSW